MRTLTRNYEHLPNRNGLSPVATVELGQEDLEALGVVKYDYNGYTFTGADPGAALKALITRERETLRKIIDDHGATEILRAALKRLDDYFIARGKLAPVPEPEKEAKSA